MPTISTQERIAILRRASRELSNISSESMPRGLNQEETRVARDFYNWLQKVIGEINGFVVRWERQLDGIDIRSRELQEIEMSFNREYTQLQKNMQNQNRQFTLVSNIMKAKHDTAKNAINNVR